MTKEVEFVKCLGHGVKMHVLEAQWAANTVILKTAKPLGNERATSHLQHPDKYSRIITKQEFIKAVSCLHVCCAPIWICYTAGQPDIIHEPGGRQRSEEDSGDSGESVLRV